MSYWSSDVCSSDWEASDVAELADGCLGLLRPRAQQGGLSLVSLLPPDLPEFWLDPLKFRQVLLNLLSNAVKFTPAGGRVTVSAAPAGDGDWVVTVADSGIGMSRSEEHTSELQSLMRHSYAVFCL